MSLSEELEEYTMSMGSLPSQSNSVGQAADGGSGMEFLQ